MQASNILVGRDGRVRLSDLGVAAKLERNFSGSQHSFASLERRNTFVGSPAYIAPELLTGIDEGCVDVLIVQASLSGSISDLCMPI